MKKDIVLSVAVVAIVIIGGIYLYNRETNGEVEDTEDIDPIGWCISGINLTEKMNQTDSVTVTDEFSDVSLEEDNEDVKSFEIKGNTTYKGREVCQAEYISDNTTLVQYFTKKRDYVVLVYKNSSGDIVNEIEMDQTSFDINSDDMAYDGIDYEDYEN